jgi:tripartite-type tricarboxylate transporter receptor subunit TctC
MAVHARAISVAILTALATALSPGLLHAQAPSAGSGQSFPTKPIRVLVGFTPGAGVDIAVRLVGPKMSEALGQSIIVDNRAGAGGNIASELVARAPADGYTLLANGAPAAISQTLYSKLAYDLLKDFEAVALIASVSQLLVIHPSLPAKTLNDFVSFAKNHRGELTFATTGSGSTPHLTTEMFKMRTGIQLLHVPYKGTPPALNDLIAGNVSFMFANILTVMPHVNSGRLRALAITSAKRSAIAPQLPTVAETYPGFESGTWFALFAPTGTPKEAVTRIHEAVTRATQAPEVRDKFIAQGAEMLSGTPQDAAAYTRAEVAKWAKVVKASGARVD